MGLRSISEVGGFFNLCPDILKILSDKGLVGQVTKR